MNLKTEPYVQQAAQWPQAGRHILAQYDDATVVVYQAYGPLIGHFAATHGYFGGAFSLDRMSWIKTNFLWMMYRSGWGMKEGQSVTLAVRLKREFFERVLQQAVPSSFDPDRYASPREWKDALTTSDVRLQWDPDHAPSGTPMRRRAVQLGLRRAVLKEYSADAIVEIVDISDFVASQRQNAAPQHTKNLITPSEIVYMPAAEVRTRLELSLQTYSS